jgi:protein SCO1
VTRLVAGLCGLALLAMGAPARADTPPNLRAEAGPTGRPSILHGVGIEQRLGEQVPLDIALRDEAGQTVRLGDSFGDKPVILLLVYYRCPMLCGQVLSGLVSSLKILTFDVGREFDIVTVSFDPNEGPELAAAKKRSTMEVYGRPGAASGWRFFTGDEAQVKRLAQSVGFSYRWDEATKQFAHGSAIFVLTPEARISRVFYGIEYAPRDVRLALVEASRGKIGSVVDQVLLFCFHYDPATGRYGPTIMAILRLAAAATVLGLGLALWRMHRKTRGRPTRPAEELS